LVEELREVEAAGGAELHRVTHGAAEEVEVRDEGTGARLALHQAVADALVKQDRELQHARADRDRDGHDQHLPHARRPHLAARAEAEADVAQRGQQDRDLERARDEAR
jgi:hypothetical protein